MDLEIFCFCDGAFNYGGKLTIVGTYDQLRLETVPQNVKVAIALKLNIPRAELREGSKLVLSFIDSRDNQIAGNIDYNIVGIPEEAKVIHIALASSVDFNITTFGLHSAVLSLDGKVLKVKEFEIVQVQN